MTEENLARATVLKESISKYNKFLDYFKPTEITSMEGSPMPLPMPGPRISLIANYIPGTIKGDITTSGRWEVTSASQVADADILAIINDIASSELSTIGGTIVETVMTKIGEMQAEFDSL